MKTGVILISFGEPAHPDGDSVHDYLTKIFFANANLEGANSDAERMSRSRELASRRAPSLIAEYQRIGGSPLNAQAELHATTLQAELERRGFSTKTYSALQFTSPSIGEIVQKAQCDGMQKLVAIPVYPLCGPSTNVMALKELRRELEKLAWDVPLFEVTGWHRHPNYSRLRAENMLKFVCAKKISLSDSSTRLIFSAHGTPQKYLQNGSRYVQYVEEYCAAIAALVGVKSYLIGYQNHSNRKIEWTQPNLEDLILAINNASIVIEPVSFMHEQSETLGELDHTTRELAERQGLQFFRVPIPHDDPAFVGVLADVAEPFIAGIEPNYYQLRQCRCKPTPGTFCLNSVK